MSYRAPRECRAGGRCLSARVNQQLGLVQLLLAGLLAVLLHVVQAAGVELPPLVDPPSGEHH
jgi:predicted enzyme related to lactoylglutathione lyase